MQFGDFRLQIIRECVFKLDGGAMFGVVPKTMWGKVSPPDDGNRITLSCNLLLIETAGGRVLVETGMGPRWSEKERERFGVHTLVGYDNVLSSLGLKNEDVDHVVISHMHFDHIGGAVMEKNGKLVPTFPKAKYYVQKGEWELAHKVNARGKASYRQDDFEPLQEHGVLAIMDGDTQVIPGVWARVTGGHTSHHQIITFESEGKKGVFFADIMPTKSHISPSWVMGYDHYPLESCDQKSHWLKKAVDEKWLIVFDHEPGVPWGHVEQSPQGKFEWKPLAAETLTPDARSTVHA